MSIAVMIKNILLNVVRTACICPIQARYGLISRDVKKLTEFGCDKVCKTD